MKKSYCVAGKNTVLELLRFSPTRVKKLHLLKDLKSDERLEEILTIAQDSGLRIEKHGDRKAIDKLASSTAHQGVLAEVSPRPEIDFEASLESAPDTCSFLFLDSIQDPHNFGAILRAAECFGVTAVVVQKDRSCPLSATVSKSSVGASEIVPIIEVTNLGRSIEQAKDAGFWVYLANRSEKSQDISEITFSGKIALVMGAEGKGPREKVLEKADFEIEIPMSGRIDSLNVSQATAVMLSQISVQLKLSAKTAG